jgi:hypothetical protein
MFFSQFFLIKVWILLLWLQILESCFVNTYREIYTIISRLSVVPVFAFLHQKHLRFKNIFVQKLAIFQPYLKKQKEIVSIK